MKKSKNILWIFVGLIVISIITFLIFSFIKNKKSVTPTNNIVDTSNKLETYINSFYKFSFKYPLNWIISENGSNKVTLNTPEHYNLIKNGNSKVSNFLLVIYKSVADVPGNSQKLSLADWFKAETKSLNDLNDIPAYFVEGANTEGSFKSIYFQKDGAVYFISLFYTNPSELEIEQQIINSIKFD